MGIDENTSSGGLEQSEILSDGNPFAGDNIDAKISSVGGSGVDWSSKTAGHASGDSGGTAGQTAVSISGSGYVLSLSYSDNGAFSDEFSIVIDGTTIANAINAKDIMGNSGNGVGVLMPFSSTFDIVDESGVPYDYGVTYALD